MGTFFRIIDIIGVNVVIKTTFLLSSYACLLLVGFKLRILPIFWFGQEIMVQFDYANCVN